jgi:hypothetical protein
MAEITENQNRKIELDTDTYCVASGYSEGGDNSCKHDYPPESMVEHDEYAYWVCSKCGMKRFYEVWE